MTNHTVLAFMAHPDDAEMFCAGTLARLADLGWRVHIATATAGDCGSISDTKWATAKTRTQEAQAAAALIDAEYHCLGEPDGFVVYDKPAIQKAINLFRHVNPSLVFTHPLRDYHMDHEQVALLCRTASFLFAAPNASDALPAPENSKTPWLYYCDPAQGIDLRGRLITPSLIVNITEQIERKAKMLAQHASQQQWLSAHHNRGDFVEHMKKLPALRGRQMGVKFAEAFVQHTGNGFPGDDILAELFGDSALQIKDDN